MTEVNKKDRIALWADLRQNRGDAPAAGLQDHFRIVMVRRISRIPAVIAEKHPLFLVFQFDYPDIERLMALQQARSGHPHLPVLMLTRHHSESLAVWAFRSGVREYLVSPVAESELRRACLWLASLSRGGRSRQGRENARPQPSLPREARLGNRAVAADSLLAAEEYLDEHLHENVTLDRVASLCGLNRFEFSRRFRREFGVTFRQYLGQRRISRAAELLAASDAQIGDVANVVGIRDQSHFCRRFRQFTGMTPTRYRELLQAR